MLMDLGHDFQGDGVMKSGIRLLPYVALLVSSSIVSGAFMPKTGYYTPWYVGGSLLAVIGLALLGT